MKLLFFVQRALKLTSVFGPVACHSPMSNLQVFQSFATNDRGRPFGRKFANPV